ncbi:MAG: TIGR01777 family oxidoreductase [Actinomycetota bacterium]
MRVAVSGAGGLIGAALVADLRRDGHEVLRLVRGGPAAPDAVRWDPHGAVDTARLEGVHAVVHLAGAGIGDRRWTAAYQAEIRDSRVSGTRTLAAALADLARPPRVLVSASAIGYYGDTGDRVVDENSPPGHDFLAQVVVDWEAAAEPARQAGIRVVHPRSGIVAAAHAGAFHRLLPLFRLGLGGRLGSGRQFWSVVSLADEVAALRFLIDREDLSGPVNVTVPRTPTNAELTRALAAALRRPALLPVPAPALRLVLGELSVQVLGSARVLPGRLTAAGFTFRHPDGPSVVASLIGHR